MSNKFLTKPTKKLIYYAHMYSHITYGLLLWGNMANQNSVKRIQKIINTGFTLITGLSPNLGNFKKERMLRLTDLIHLENNRLGYQLEKGPPFPVTCMTYSGQTVETNHCKKLINTVTFSERFVHFCLKSHEPMSLFFQ